MRGQRGSGVLLDLRQTSDFRRLKMREVRSLKSGEYGGLNSSRRGVIGEPRIWLLCKYSPFINCFLWLNIFGLVTRFEFMPTHLTLDGIVLFLGGKLEQAKCTRRTRWG
jgi:hypothetical protein